MEKTSKRKKIATTIGFILLLSIVFGVVLVLMISSSVKWFAYLILVACVGILVVLRKKVFWHGWKIPLFWILALVIAWGSLFAGQPPLDRTYNALHLDYDAPQVAAAYKAEDGLYEEYNLKHEDVFVEMKKYHIKVRVTKVGEGPPVIIVPGNVGEAYPFVPLLPELKGHTIYIINRPGGGMSEGINYLQVDFKQFAIDTIKDVMDSLSIEKAPLIAHSIGGDWALWFTQAYPERVESLTLIGVPGGLPGTRVPLSILMLQLPGIDNILSKTTGIDFITRNIQGTSTSPAMEQCRKAFTILPNYNTAFTSLLAATRMSRKEILNVEDLAKFKTPTLLLWGDKDPFGTPAAGQKIANMLPNGIFKEVSGGHLAWQQQPEKCGEIIREFWESSY
jgi:pimeloyl-ACP methyl ester carboxylesterase